MQLKLVHNVTASEREQADPARSVFEHWAYMTGRTKRCIYGPKRARLIEQWLRYYDAQTLMLACEGMAASAWHAGDNPRGTRCDEIELMLRDEAHIERFASEGESLRDKMARRVRRIQSAEKAAQDGVGAQEAEQYRQALRDMAATMAGRKRS